MDRGHTCRLGVWREGLLRSLAVKPPNNGHLRMTVMITHPPTLASDTTLNGLEEVERNQRINSGAVAVLGQVHRRKEMARAFEQIAFLFRNAPAESGLD